MKGNISVKDQYESVSCYLWSHQFVLLFTLKDIIYLKKKKKKKKDHDSSKEEQ